MPIGVEKTRIKDLNSITQQNQLLDKVIEVETSAGTDQNFKVSIPTIIQTVANNLPGANNTKSGYKMVRCYSNASPQWYEGSSTLTELNPDFLCLGTTCKCEFPNEEYILVYDAGSTLQVYVDGDFTEPKVPAKWVERDSIEEKVNSIADFNPFEDTYAEGQTVKFLINGEYRLFSAKVAMDRGQLPNYFMPTPSGNSNDPYWRELNPAGLTKIENWLPGDYKKNTIVIYNNQFIRAKRDLSGSLISTGDQAADDAPADLDWEFIGGGGSGGGDYYVYDDTVIKARISAVETTVEGLESDLNSTNLSLTSRINAIVSTANDWVAGSYTKGQFVRNGVGVFIAKNNIQNSTVAPTSTNVSWLQINGSAAIDNGSITEVMLDAELTAKVNSAGDVTQSYVDDKISEVNAVDINLQNQITNIRNNPLPKVYATSLSGSVYQGSDLANAFQFTGIFGNILLFYPFSLTQNAVLAAGTHVVGNNFITSLNDYKMFTREYSRVSNLIVQSGGLSVNGLGGTYYNNCFLSNVYIEIPVGKVVTFVDCDFNCNSGFVLFKGGGTVYLKGSSSIPTGATIEAGTTVTIESGSTTPSGPAVTPAPTNPIQNDVLDTFDYTLPSGYILSDIQQTLDGGATWIQAAKPIQVGNIDVPVNGVGVRTRSIGANPASSVLWNTAVYTKAAGAPDGLIPSDEANFNIQGGWGNIGGWIIEPNQIRANGGMGYYLRNFTASGTGVVKVMIGEITGTAPLRLVTNTGFDVYPNTAGLHTFSITFGGGNDTIHIGGQGGFVGTVDWIQIIPN
ncbi:hypothetical protein [Hymenobacter sp. APR13]|uniref:hypothetical protein n=1 Tax=Hymenobacter sp. APR13 TaxID=1356852 RepID=UPI000B0D8970|nr:hypothetical protein [Hymenobacter sp. APR13]